jgi:uncharacterized protein YqjF (DUF2071 family)
VPYRWARIRSERSADHLAYRSRRLAPPGRRSTTDFAVRPREQVAADPLSIFLTARWGMHHHVVRRQPLWVPNAHDPWPLRRAELLHCDDGLLAAAGFPDVAARRPESVLWSPGVRTRFGMPRRSEGTVR